MGRSTEYTSDMPDKVAEYLKTYEDQGDAVPSIVGLCSYLNRARSTLYKWAKEPGKEAFSDMLDAVNEAQERITLNGGLKNEMNATIVKLLLAKHGYAERQDIKHDIGSFVEMLDAQAEAIASQHMQQLKED